MGEKIEITEKKTANGWAFVVRVGSSRNVQKYSVFLEKTYFEKLTAGGGTPKDLIKKSFIFLLEREPKESILSTFNLKVISKYFPEFENSIQNT